MTPRRLMRCVSALIVSGGLAYGALAGGTGTAHADVLGYPNASEACKAFNDFGFSHGACVSMLESNGQSSAFFASLCKTFTFPTQFFDVTAGTFVTIKNHGECVSFFNEQTKG